MKFKQLSFILFVALFVQQAFAGNTNNQDAIHETTSPVDVILETSMGSFTLEFYPDEAPKTVENFLRYVDEGFYDNTLFHRVIPGFVIQGGGFEKGMKRKRTHAPVSNESDNGLKNIRGSISMARTNSPHSATSQFFINVVSNPSLDLQGRRYGYTVFGKVSAGMEVIDQIAAVTTNKAGRYKDIPEEDVVILSAKRKGSPAAKGNDNNSGALQTNQERFKAGEHYVVLDNPVPPRDHSKIEVVEMFSYGCPHCYEFEPLVKEWGQQQDADIDFWFFPAAWNKPMAFLAQAFYTARELGIADKIHFPLFTAIVIDQKKISNENELAGFFTNFGVDKKSFSRAFNSKAVKILVKRAKLRVQNYNPGDVPEIVVNGKYRIDRMRAGGYAEMLAVAEFLINKERARLKK